MADSEPINWQPIQAVSIKKEKGIQSKYVLNHKALGEVLEQINDKPVAVIPIVGPSRQGKSFILNYMIRFLSNPKSIDWIGKNDEPLEGFGWKSDVDPQTLGLWLSKPFILKQSNGKEIAVILMDTQGVFDEYSNQRDWSTIVGISLLLSSYLIFNIFTNLQEDVLITLESFLQYGLQAAKANPESNEKPFQNLMFLIRDWNTPAQFRYGLSGGKAFLERKLELKDNQSHSARVVRQLLDKCFKEVSCFLMPKIGEKAEEEDFNGSIDGLPERFVDKMKEFIFFLLNPEELKPKTIDNNTITGEELFQYFKTYVQVFNSDELPNPTDLVEATAKTKDLIHLNKLKESNLTQMRAFIRLKAFVSRKKLMEEFTQIKSETIETFDGLKKSTTNQILNELNEIMENNLKSNYEQIWNENEIRRNQFMNKESEKCVEQLDKLVSGHLNSTFLDPQDFDEYLRKSKKQILNDFKKNFDDEEEELFARDVNKLNKEMDSLENNFKTENSRRISDAKRINTEAIEEAVGLYKRSMKDILEGNIYLTKDLFKPLEKETEKSAKHLFKQKCSAGDNEFKKKFVFDFEQKLRTEREEFKDQNQLKCERVEMSTEKLKTNSLDEYNQRINNMFDSFTSEEDINECHEEVKQKSMDAFNYSCLYKDQQFLNKYLDQLEEDINKSFNEFKKKLSERLSGLHNSFSAKLIEARDTYIQAMDSNFNENCCTDEDLDELNKKSRNEAILKFESHSIVVTNGIDVNKYSTDLEKCLSDEFEKYVQKNQMNRELKQRDLKDIVENSIDSYDQQMETHIDSVNTELELIEKHEQIKSKLITEFKLTKLSTDVSEFETHLTKLEHKIEDSFRDALELLELRLKNQASIAKNLITDVRKFYREEMDKYYQRTSYLSKENLIKNHESVVRRCADKYESERGIMSLDIYQKLIEDNVKDVYEKIVSENDMNTPTLMQAIGIDLGTTNSCVAYYKSDRRNGSSVVVIPNELGRNVTPSMVSIRNEGKVVGDIAKEEIRSHPYNTIYSAKRLIGRNFSDQSVQKYMKHWSYMVVDDGNDNPKIKVSVNNIEETYFAEQISAEVLKKMKEIAENHLGIKVTKAVITVPAYFTDSQKEATKDAGKLAGLEVLKIINEPTAAAIAFQLNKSDNHSSRKVLIYDFGGGTFDVAVLNVEKGEIKVMAVGGDNCLGGDDFDSNLIDYCLKEFKSQTGYDVSTNDKNGAIAVTRLRRVCEENKCKLSATDTTIIVIDGFYANEELRVDLTRDKFEELNEELIINSMDLVAQTLEDAGLIHSEIDDIVLVGGSTRIPRVQDMLSDQFAGRALNHHINPDEAVAMGAATQAAILNGQQAQGLGHLRVVDVAPMSLGIKVKDGFMSVIIPRNSKVPNSYERIYTTVSDYQTTVDVEVFEGEEQMAENNRSLGKFELKGIPAAPKGEQNIKVLFEITDEGILRVTAKIVSTGGEEEIEIKEHKGRLTDQELEQLIIQGSTN